ncbi:MAG: hypothetical protein LH702_18990 [Phormidesmis sp. CAN_BIN44]|nr:hypothetical protein [Phormidesmis sp. CAN_BIN44]
MATNPPDRLDRIEAIVESIAFALRNMQVKQDRMQEQQDRMQQSFDRMQEQQDRTQQHLDQVGRFVADISNDVAQVSANQERQDVRMAQLTANVESLVSALQNRFTSNGGA